MMVFLCLEIELIPIIYHISLQNILYVSEDAYIIQSFIYRYTESFVIFHWHTSGHIISIRSSANESTQTMK